MITIDEIDNRFYIDKSTLHNAGYGLFAKEHIKEGDWLEIIGVLVKRGSIADICTHFARRYKFMGKNDTKIVPFGFAGLINHTEDSEKQNVVIKSIKGLHKKSDNASELVCLFTKNVNPGEEILSHYGDEFAEEIKEMKENVSFLNNNKSDWEEFLEYNLYNMRSLCEMLD